MFVPVGLSDAIALAHIELTNWFAWQAPQLQNAYSFAPILQLIRIANEVILIMIITTTIVNNSFYII